MLILLWEGQEAYMYHENCNKRGTSCYQDDILQWGMIKGFGGWEERVAGMSFELFIKKAALQQPVNYHHEHPDEEDNVLLRWFWSHCVYLALDEEILAMAAYEGFWEEGSKVDHDLSQKRADGAKSHLGWKLISIGPFGSAGALS